METVRKVVEEVILISFFVCFCFISFYFVFYGEVLYRQMMAFASTLFCGKTACICFLKATGQKKGYQTRFASQAMTAVSGFVLGIALLIKFFS